MTYNLEAIKKKIEQLSGKQNSNKINWFKPGLGQYNVRFLPYNTENGQPFQEVAYYDSRLISETRIVAPVQFGLPDPIFDLVTELKKDRSKEAWKVWKNLLPKERYYAPILVRGEEEKGVQIWELNSRLVKDIYTILAHPDYRDEDLMHPINGYDFTIIVTPTEKSYNGYPVREIKLQPRRKSSLLCEDKNECEKLMASIPDLQNYFRAQVKPYEELITILENLKNSLSEELSEENNKNDGNMEMQNNKLTKKIDEVFDDL